ncbi:MAG: GAF domain-containing protein [Desulfobulbaceae bacterium]|nr:GAF domain-containing protein [Desulfobulbaceae bacterium]
MNDQLPHEKSQQQTTDQKEEELLLSQKRLKAVKELGLLATSSPNLDVVLQRILKGTTEAAGASVGMIFLKDPKSRLFKWGASLGLSEEFVADFRNKNIRHGEGLTGIIAQTGEPIYIQEDSSHDPRIARQIVANEKFNSFIGVPLYAGDEIIGVMNILTRKPEILREQEISLIAAIGAHVGSAILNAQLFKQLQEAESTLKAEQNFMETLINALSDTFFVFEADTGRARRWNKIFNKISGYTDQEIASNKAPDFYYSAEEKNKAAAVIDLLKRHGKASVELSLISKDRQQIPFEYSAALVQNPLDAQPLIIAIGRDLTERQKMEQELLKAQKLESIAILAGGIAHDFNNLLTGILGNISLAGRLANQDKKLHRYLTNAKKASCRAQDLTQQLLTFSKGGMPVRKSVDLPCIIKETTDFLLHGSNIACRFLLPDDLWSAEVDEGQISQVFQNLLLNATQAMPEGGQITITANNFLTSPDCNLPLQEGHYILISVGDQGCGVSVEHISKIFDPYFTTKQQGSGLGLATCYSIVKNHNGHISVESESGTGTTFHIYLPAATKKQKCKKSSSPEKLEKMNKKILIMDDEKDIRDVASFMLQEIGCDVALAHDGCEAINQYRHALERAQPFDAVIMDLTIPGGMGGKEAVEELLRIDPDTRVIASSGYSNDPVMANFSQYGFKGCLGKPYTFTRLVKTLQDIFT